MSNFDQMIQSEYDSYTIRRNRVNTPLKLARLYLKLLGVVSSAKAASTLSNWFFTPMRSKPSKKDVEIVTKAVVQKPLSLASGIKFESFCWGQGDKRVVVAHGWESKASHLRLFIEELLNQGFQVIAYDAPGHGLSEGNKSDVIEFAELLFELEKEYGSFYGAIGHSLGGLALINAMKRGLQVQQAVVISVPSSFPEILHKYAKILAVPDRLHQSLRESVKQHFSKDDSVWDELTAYKGLETIETPIAIFHDVDDEEVLSIESECLAQSWPNSALVKTRGLGHRRIIKSKDVVNKAVAVML